VTIKVSIRFNPESGLFEDFSVESDGELTPSHLHDERHDEITREIASEIEENPDVVEISQREADAMLAARQASEALDEMLREDGELGEGRETG
jgi:hypothetical protein